MSLNRSTWNKFVKARGHFRRITEETERSVPQLKKIQQKFADSRAGKNSSYTVETPVVYNSALDEITADDEIKLILVADNPGRCEQAAENRRYLVGPSGKIAQKFFLGNPQLGIDFTKNVIILNKTPIHSPRTAELKQLCLTEDGSNSIAASLEESQNKMALLLLEFQEALCVPVYIIGYSEMKKGGIFETYTETLNKLYTGKKHLYDQVFLFRHFSMNQFTIDLKKRALKGETVEKSLARIGIAYRDRVFKIFCNKSLQINT